MKIHRTALCMLLCMLICFAAGCGPGAGGNAGTPPGAGSQQQTEQESPPAQTQTQTPTPPPEPPSESPSPPPEEPRPDTFEEQIARTIQATITMENGGVIVIELYPDLAPQSVRNFVYLARQGFYDGLNFHRIMKGFMIQGGCPDGTGTGNPGYKIKGEFLENGFDNELKHARGVLSMARGGDFDSAGSQFFICHGDAFFLDTKYAAFGKVVDGMDVVDKITDVKNTDNNGGVEEKDKPVIKSITIDDDIELPEPIKLK